MRTLRLQRVKSHVSVTPEHLGSLTSVATLDVPCSQAWTPLQGCLGTGGVHCTSISAVLNLGACDFRKFRPPSAPAPRGPTQRRHLGPSDLNRYFFNFVLTEPFFFNDWTLQILMEISKLLICWEYAGVFYFSCWLVAAAVRKPLYPFFFFFRPHGNSISMLNM